MNAGETGLAMMENLRSPSPKSLNHPRHGIE